MSNAMSYELSSVSSICMMTRGTGANNVCMWGGHDDLHMLMPMQHPMQPKGCPLVTLSTEAHLCSCAHRLGARFEDENNKQEMQSVASKSRLCMALCRW